MIRECTNAEYHADHSAVSKSMMSVFLSDGPLEYYERFVAKTKPAWTKQKREMRLGDLCHTAVLEPDRFARDYLISPTWATTKRLAKVFEAENPGKTIISRDEKRKVELIIESVRGAAPTIMAAPGWVERSYYFTDEETGLLLKARADKVIPMPTMENPEWLVILDYKTTHDADAARFTWVARRFDYGIQQVHYSNVIGGATGLPVQFAFLVSETKDKYRTELYDLKPADVSQSAGKLRNTLRRIAECHATGEWKT